MKFYLLNKTRHFLVIFFLVFCVFSSANPVVFADEKNEIKQEKNKAPLKTNAVAIDLNSEKLEYFPEKSEFVATGSAEVVITEQGSKLKAKRIVFDQNKQVMTAYGDVRIIKNGLEMKGDYAIIDLNKESALVSNPNTSVDVINIKAKTANLYTDNIEALNGSAVINEKLNLILSSDGFSSSKGGSFVNPSSINTRVKPTYTIKTKEISIKATKYRNIIKLENASIYVGKIRIAYIPVLELSTDKEIAEIETMLPEIGNNQEMGFYAGPSQVFHLPKGTTLKVSPLVVNGDGHIGYGGLARITTPFNKTEIIYGSSKKNTVIKGEQKFITPSSKIVYGKNAYMEDGFLGERKPGLLIEAIDEHKYYIKDLDVNYVSRLSAGYASDYRKDWGTARFKVQGDITNANPLWSYGDLVQFTMVSQYDVSVYGNGDTFALVRFGPSIASTIGPLFNSVTYFQSAIHGKTPFDFDRYYYGKSNVNLSSSAKITKYLDVVYYGSLNLAKDNWDQRLLAENQFYIKFGPEDFKLRLGYDTVREQSIFGVDLLVGAERTSINFDKFKVINPNDLSKPKEKKPTSKKTINL